MSWHFSAALVEASLGANSLDGDALEPWKLGNINVGRLAKDKMTAALVLSRFGTMLPLSAKTIPKPLNISSGLEGRSQGNSSSVAGSPSDLAKTLAQPERVQESAESEADSGKSLPASFAKWDPDTSSWKTHQYSLLGGLESYSETWPRWGMMLDGESFQLPTPSGLLALRAWITSESESGSSLPTPTASMLTEADMEQAKYAGNSGDRPSYQDAKRMPTLRKSDSERGGRWDLIQAVRGNPNKHYTRMTTPCADDTGLRKAKYAQGGTALSHQVLLLQMELVAEYRRLQTPVADDAVNRKEGKFNSRGEPKLSAQVKRLPTVVSVSESGGRCGLDGGSHARAKMTDQEIKELTGGSLNPEWTEWFMGWPIGWTALEPSGMGKLRQWFDSHGGF